MLDKLCLFLQFIAVVSALQNAQTHLRVMTFNVWTSGDHVDQGLYKIAKHIRIVDADVIAVQEGRIDEILSELGPGYHGILGFGLITKHEIDLSTLIRAPRSNGVKINLLNSTKSFYFHSLHLNYRNFGPDVAKKAMHKQEIDLAEKQRVAELQALIDNPGFQAHVQSATSGGIPLIVAGDFNSPSHLDWIESTKHLHGGWVYEWPAPKLISDNASLTDSFRAIYPDPLAVPGNTWSTCMSEEAPNRIDLILFNSPKLIPVKSFIYSGSLPLKPYPNHECNDYPSDHFAVVTDFLYV